MGLLRALRAGVEGLPVGLVADLADNALGDLDLPGLLLEVQAVHANVGHEGERLGRSVEPLRPPGLAQQRPAGVGRGRQPLDLAVLDDQDGPVVALGLPGGDTLVDVQNRLVGPDVQHVPQAVGRVGSVKVRPPPTRYMPAGK